MALPSEQHYDELQHITLTQYSLKKGLKTFGLQQVDAICDEPKQLHECKVREPWATTEHSKEQKQKALGYLVFLNKREQERLRGEGVQNCAARGYIPQRTKHGHQLL